MSFKKADPGQGFLKMSVYGPPGSGKTFTTLQWAEKLALNSKKRIAMVDTERGSDFYAKAIKERKVHPEKFDFDAFYSRSLLDVDREIRGIDFKKHGVIIVDSFTHMWEAAIASYEGKMNSNDAIPMQAWSSIKRPYKSLVQFLMDAPAHVFILGRQKNVFDTTDGEFRRIGVAMACEGNTPYEPQICCRMEAVQNEKDTTKTTYIALFEKDRTGVLSGRTFPNPNGSVVESLLPCLGDKHAVSEDPDEIAERDSDLLEKDKEKRLLKAEISKKLLADYTAKINSAEDLEGLAKIASLIKKDKRKMELSHVHSLEIVYKEQNNSLSANIAPKEL